jgi:death-on-curing protein
LTSPEFARKAGLLAARLTRNHPLPDGSKRVAWLALIELAGRNGSRFAQPEVEDAVGSWLGS